MNHREICQLLDVTGPEQEELFARARLARDRAFGGTVVVRGVIEMTNLCRVDCSYCPMRRSNADPNTAYILSVDELVAAAQAVCEAGIDVVLIQGGESHRALHTVVNGIPQIVDAFGGRVEVLLNLGVASADIVARLRQAGAKSYIVKHETSDPALHRRHRGEPLERRLEMVRRLQQHGFHVGMGMIVGLPGQTEDSLVRDIQVAIDYGADMCSVSPFMPAADTPLASEARGSVNRAQNLIAIMRILQPGWLIPSVSALEALEPGAQLGGLHAGANVMTVNFSPPKARAEYLIYGSKRYIVGIQHVHRAIAASGLRPTGSVFL